ncbi:thioredoxin family protein [Wenyingzhuangia sp. IMCC45574]
MARTPSNIMEVGATAPDFLLPDTVSGKEMSLQQLKGEIGTVVLFICNHCPFVIHINPLLVALANDYQAKGVSFVAISSNDVENYPQDAPDKMKVHAEENNYPFPYLYDESQEVAKAYDAACTPDIYVFDSELKSYYHGQLDGSRPGNDIPVTGEDIKAALDLLLQGENYKGSVYPSIGCGIKWK